MVKASEIQDEFSLRAWVEELPVEGAQILSFRAAARLLPIQFDSPSWLYEDRSREAGLAVLRSLMTAFVACRGSNRLVRLAADSATSGTMSLVTEMPITPARIAIHSAAHASATAFSALAVRLPLQTLEDEVAVTIRSDCLENAFEAMDNARLAEGSDSSGVWEQLMSDAQALEIGLSLVAAPLWSIEKGKEKDWQQLKNDWSTPNSPYDFWRRWYETLLDPEANTPFPQDLLTQIALIPDEMWEGKDGPEKIATEIARLEELFAEKPTTPPDVERRVAQLPPASTSRVEATRLAMVSHRDELPSSIEAVTSFAALEIHRLQTRNFDPDPEETKRQIRTLRVIHDAVEKLEPLVPDADDMPEKDAEQAEKLARLLLTKFKEWPREHADELVDGTYQFALEASGAATRLGLVAATAFLLPMVGVSANLALAAGLTVFGGKKLSEAAKGLLFPKSGA